MGRPLPPLIGAMPERKHFFSIDVFPYNADALNHAIHANHIAMWHAMLNHAALDKLFWEKHSQNLVTGLPARMDVGMVVTQEYLYCTYKKK